MCAVVGVYDYSGTAGGVDRDELRTVCDHMAARGPDGSGEWFSRDGRVALAHRRLSVIDLSPRAAQPMASSDGALVISFNGEIYNHRELRCELQARGRVFRTKSDTEVLLQLYEEHGMAMLDKLRGMFAFALWDGRRRALLVARDPFGVKPLYFADDGATLRVASQVKALLRARVDTSPEPAGHAGFFLWGSVPSPWTLYRGIRSLPAGHFMWVRESGREPPRPYCLVRDILAEAAAEPARGSPQDALDQISAALVASVRAHLVSDVPVGIFLSGGLDSAMIASLVAERGVQPRTITLGFAEYAGTAEDEVPLAEALAGTLGTRHDTVIVRRADFEAEREKLLAAMDQPSIDGVNTWFVARAAAAKGLKVALSGLGGDELFGSYPSFRQVPLLARLAGPFANMSWLGRTARRTCEPLLRRVTSPKYAGLLEYGGTMAGAYLLRRGLYMPWELPRVIDPDMARTGWQDLLTMAGLEEACRAIRGTARERLTITALEMSWYMRHQLLKDADWAGMAHSVEIRLPLVDVPLLKAAAPWIAAYPSLTKQAVASAAAHTMGQGRHKPKTGFSMPVREWLGSRSTRGLRGWARHVHDHHVLPAGQRNAGAKRVLVSTMAPGNGGVTAMTRFVVQHLAERGLEPVIAHYAPYSAMPALSVPSFRLFQRGIGWRQGLAYGERESHAIGAWLPELEFTHYMATRHWRELMEQCEACVAVSGNVLAATPFWQTGRPYLAWVATDWDGDRRDRVKEFPLVRRLLDAWINTPVIRRLERKLLRSGRIVTLSGFTASVLSNIAGERFDTVMLPIPVDSTLFVPKPDAVVPGRLGFAGRFNDPRKNVGLLLRAAGELRGRGLDVSLILIGDSPESRITQLVAQLGLENHVSFTPHLPHDPMRDWMQTLDVFAVPSHQEGLCIAALEALACGVPVVSTRCGGPQEFVLPGITGSLVDPDPGQMADAIAALLLDRKLRSRMSTAARQLVEERYSVARAHAVFGHALRTAFPELEGERPAPAAAGFTEIIANGPLT